MASGYARPALSVKEQCRSTYVVPSPKPRSKQAINLRFAANSITIEGLCYSSADSDRVLSELHNLGAERSDCIMP
ncbi:hypothetical protein EGR_10485 [Echinococcus granulosus]|uniref:Uncharacterized protein n=1 Tax=Echinococcus granulosus TaxID=6210 RepID=W6UMD1_ECHGR|nr:hypothetical protein EGR_10485 [Echinococcus granulosus]EUB54649.1 hypothetical protein EGR_10485 [Echinococcus granulosus]